jgi:glutaminase
MLTTSSPVSTGHLPAAERVRALVAEAHERFTSIDEGKNADYIPALAKVPSDLFGVCIVGASGIAFAAGDAEYEFSIQSASKPFVFAQICQIIGEDETREKVGVNSTGLPFNSVVGVERSSDGTTNPMVNAGAIAAASLAPGTTADAKWQFLTGCPSSPEEALPLTARCISPRQLPTSGTKASPACSRATTEFTSILSRQLTFTPSSAR